MWWDAQSVWFSMPFGGPTYIIVNGKNLGMRSTYSGRQPLMEDDLRWKIPFDGRQPSIENELKWNTTFDGIKPSLEDNF